MKLTSKLNPAKFFGTRNSIPLENMNPTNCENCGQEFKGHFCPKCGQEVTEFSRPFGFVLYDFVGNFFAFDTRFFQTFKFLLFRPGFLASEFFKGRRVRYSPPFRIFVFLSFVLFILLQSLTERSLDKAIENKESISSEQVKNSTGGVLKTDISVKTDSVEILNLDSLSKLPVLAEDSVKIGNISLNLDLSIFNSGNIRENLNKLADQIQEKLDLTNDPQDRKKLSTYIAMCRAPEMAISNIMKYLSWMFFILLPVFALILKLFYIRRHQLFIKHLIFSIHLHSYLFFILIIVTSLRLLFDTGLSTINGILLFTFPVYFFIALLKFYGQTYGKVFLKFIGISFIYNVVLLSAVLYVFFKSFGIA